MAKWIPLVLIAACLCGCVERRVYLISDPPGADAYIDGEFVGTTRPKDDPKGPLYANFVFYGRRDFTFRKPGYATHETTFHLETPWYEYPPIDFFAEVLAPWIIVNEHTVEVKLEESRPADTGRLLERASDFRKGSRPEDLYEFVTIKGRHKPARK
jgi:hypothetical protein